MARYTTVQNLVDEINAKIADMQASTYAWERERLISSGRDEPSFATAIVLNAFREALPHKWLGIHGYYSCEIAKVISGYDNRVRISFAMNHSHPYYPLAGDLTKVDLPVISLKRKKMRVECFRGVETKLCFYEAIPADEIAPDKTLFSFFTDAEQESFTRVDGGIEKAKMLTKYLEELGPKKMYDFLNVCTRTVFTGENNSLAFSWDNYDKAVNHPEKMDDFENEIWERNVLNPHCFDKTFALYEKDCARFRRE